MTMLFRDALPRPNSFNETDRTIEAIIATSTPVGKRGLAGAYFEILDPAGADLTALRGAPLLDSHRQDGIGRVLGAVDDVRIEGDQIVAKLKFSSRPDVAPVIEDVRSGILKGISIGYVVDQWREGTDTKGNKTRTAAKWKPKEVSLCAIPQDDRCTVRSEMENENEDQNQDQTRANINREIRELARRAGCNTTVVDALIDRQATLEDARQSILDDVIGRGRTPLRPHNDETVDNPTVLRRALSDALYTRVDPSFEPPGPARGYVGLTIPDMARELLRRSGESVAGFSPSTLITRALHTTSDFPLILGDTVGRTLRQSYTAAPMTIKRLARETTARDFRAKSRLMLDSAGIGLEKVNEHGEFESGTIVEAAESYKVETFGKIIGLTRQALVNDDLGAFSDLARRMGQAAAAFEASHLVELLVSNSGNGPTMSDSDPLFHADHGNKAASGAAIAEATLSAGRLAMRQQTGPGGELIAVTPRYVLVSPENETTAEKVLSAIQATTVADVNPFSALAIVVEPRLSGTRWYIVADPAEIDGLEYAYLAGAPGPQIESRAGFEIDGVQIKVRLDFGAGFVDWRGWYANAGS